ncbi:RHS domain-containing protein [Brucepastera parasyntrophica]|uniref:RHS repeat domain-containing protein n=1 Tax=Brucepastera parasyntrophica TaxID=2880008 RepID=UPI00210B9C22|nr:RHS repeat-associated core domain-containing protein [Brucepastera parasyntrophica]ULQ59123.1 RHS domain-containing protein [Brucepastera parasyntrophica]
METRFIKVHSTWDERDGSYEAEDAHTVAGNVRDLVEVWYTIEGQQSGWTYDETGNRIRESVNRGGNRVTETEYYRHTNLIRTRGEWEYNYDANGNLIERGTNGVWNESSRRYEYDGEEGELWKYEYDLSNRLVRVLYTKEGSANLSEAASYEYDLRGLKVKSERNGESEYTQYDQGGNLVWKEKGEESSRYVRAGSTVWAEERISGNITAVYYHHTDHLGTSEVITDASGVIVWEANYGAFDGVLSTGGSMAFTASYTGKELDEATGLYYFNARWYDRSLGKFITEDPARDGTNWYEYCRNNPLRFVDPDGLSIIGAFRGLVKATKGFLEISGGSLWVQP